MGTSLETQGVWWLPDSPNHKVGGWLTYDDVDGGRLILGGTLRPTIWDDNIRADGSVQKVPRKYVAAGDERAYPIIHGQQGQKAFTLINSFQTRVSGYRSPTETEEVTVNAMLTGAWFGDTDGLKFDHAKISLRHATAFVGKNGVSSKFTFAEGSDHRYSVITATMIPPIEAQTGGTKVAFTHVLEQCGDQFHDTNMKQRWRVDISVAGVEPIQDFLDVMSDMQDLITIASGSTASIDDFEFEHPELYEHTSGGTRIDGLRKPLPYRARWSQRSRTDHLVKQHQFYFTLNDLGGAEGLSRWLTAAQQYRTELGRAMATRYSDTMFLEDRIANLCAALESLDAVRRMTPRNEDFVEHINACMALAGAPFTGMLITDAVQWAKNIKEIRHDLAHHRERYRTNATPIEHLVSEQLFWLFVFCILRIAEAPPAVLASISKHSKIQWLREQAVTADTL